VSGGRWNSIRGEGGSAPSPSSCIIAGGSGNEIVPGNVIDGFSDFSTISGGESNRVMSETDHAVIGGGGQNSIGYQVSYSFIGGGLQNDILGGGAFPHVFIQYQTIAGGHGNRIASGGFGGSGATIGGGESNTIAS